MSLGHHTQNNLSTSQINQPPNPPQRPDPLRPLPLPSGLLHLLAIDESSMMLRFVRSVKLVVEPITANRCLCINSELPSLMPAFLRRNALLLALQAAEKGRDTDAAIEAVVDVEVFRRRCLTLSPEARLILAHILDAGSCDSSSSSVAALSRLRFSSRPGYFCLRGTLGLGGGGAGLVGETVCLAIAGLAAYSPETRSRPRELLGHARYVVLRGVILCGTSLFCRILSAASIP